MAELSRVDTTPGGAFRKLTWNRDTAGSWCVFLAIFIFFRIPALINAGDVNSDGAITGLQARHMLRGEWSWLHWGRVYLTSLDSLMAAPLFAIFGASAFTLMLATLCGQLTGASLVYAVVRRRVGRWAGIVPMLPIVLATMAFNIYLFFDIRQWCLATALAGFWLLDGASASRYPLPRYAAGVFVGMMAMFIDLFAVQFIAGLGVFAFLCALDEHRGTLQLLKRLAVLGAAAVAAMATISSLRALAHVSTERASWSIDHIPGNSRLLFDTCLPWVIGTKVFYVGNEPRNELWNPPAFFSAVQSLGALVLVAGTVFGGVSLCMRRMPWKVRRTGVGGAVVALTALAGFLVTATATDIYGARLLAPMLLTLPFALTPAAFYLRGWRFPVAFSPYIVSAAVACWVSYGTFVRGILPVRVPRGTAAEEEDVAKALRERGVHYAGAHYWVAYRLTFLYGEDPIVVPVDSEDRYPPYRAAFDVASKTEPTAYIFHPWWPYLSLADYEQRFRQSGTRFEKLKIHDFTVFVVNPKG